jgi:hypothetical protein
MAYLFENPINRIYDIRLVFKRIIPYLRGAELFVLNDFVWFIVLLA